MTDADLKTRWWLPHWQLKMLESPVNSCCNTDHEQDLETLKAFDTGRFVWMLCFCSYSLIGKGTILFEINFFLKEDRNLRQSRASIELLGDWLTPSFLRNSPIIHRNYRNLPHSEPWNSEDYLWNTISKTTMST